MIPGIIEMPIGNRAFLIGVPESSGCKTKSKSSFALTPVIYTEA